MVRIISLGCLFILFLTIISCRKKIAQSVPTEKPVQVPVPPSSDPELTSDQEKSLFKIGKDLGVRGSGASGCKDEICKTVEIFGLDGLNIPSKPGWLEQIVLDNISLKNNVLRVKKSSLEKFLTDRKYSSILGFIQNERGILGIRLILDNPGENIQDLSFKIETTGMTAAMQIGVHTGFNTNKRIRITEKDGLKGFIKTTALISKPVRKPRYGIYYLLLHLSFQEIKELYDKIKSGTKVNLKITGTAKDYPEDIETIAVRLE